MIFYLLQVLLLCTQVQSDEAFQPELTQDFPNLLGLARIKAWMDPAVDPCNDFYMHSCGGFKKRYKYLQNNTDVIGLMSKSSALLMSMILNQTSDPMAKTPVERDLFWKTTDYYRSCVRKDVIEAKGFRPIKSTANSILSKWDDPKSNLLTIFGEMQSEAGVKLLFLSKYTSVPSKDIHQLRLQFVPSQAYKHISRDTVWEIMHTYVDNDVILSTKNLKSICDKIYLLEKRHFKFVRRLNRAHKGADRPDQYQTIKQISQETHLDWSLYLKPLKLDNVTEIHLWADSKTWIKEIKYFAGLDRELLKYYSLWRLALAHFNKLPEPYYGLWKKIYKKASKMRYYSVDTAMTFLRHDCVKETGANLKYLAGHLYVKYAFNATQKEHATIMVDNLFNTMRIRLQSLKWMDSRSKSAAIKKLDNLVRIVGYLMNLHRFPDWVMDPYKVASYYRPLKFKTDTYFENAVQAQIFTELMPSIRHSRSHNIERGSLFKDHMWLLNAVHLVNLVQIQINPGFIQRPLFSTLNPSAMNYGSLGAVVGHEMNHAFDSFGSQFDSEGVRRGWMSESSMDEFQDRADCFVEQYSNMTAVFSDGHESHIDGEHTLTENIADNGGMHTAFSAWSSLETGNIYKKDPGEEWSRAQVFWFAFAQTNCDVESDKKLRRQLRKDVHSPKPARVNGALRNSLEFAKAFRCKLHSPMHPLKEKDTCRLL